MRAVELTARGHGAVSVVIVEGAGTLARVSKLAGGRPIEAGSFTLARLTVEGQPLDEALVIATGAQRCELHLHGNPFLVRALLRELDCTGETRQERTQTALARARLRSAESDSGARILLDQSQGALGRELASMLGLEDEEELRAAARALLERSRVAERAIEAARVVLAGPVNAGKSTLFNVLMGERRVTTGAEAGTTRDAIRERVHFGAYPVELVDTAGTRDLSGVEGQVGLERLAQDRARLWRARAELVIHLRPPGAPEPEQSEDGTARIVSSRLDLSTGEERGGISPLERPKEARERIVELFRGALCLPEEPWEPGRGAVLGEDARAELARCSFLDAARLRAAIERFDAGTLGDVDGSRAPS